MIQFSFYPVRTEQCDVFCIYGSEQWYGTFTGRSKSCRDSAPAVWTNQVLHGKEG